MTSNWNKTKNWLKDHLNTQVFETWINPLTLNEITETEIKINAPSSFIKDWVTDNYIDALNKAVRETTGSALNITIIVSDEETITSSARISRIPTTNTASPANDYRKRLNPKYTFSNFIVGTSNQLPHAASMAVASEIGTRYNPLFIYGGVGLGKTHLLHAIGNQLLAKNPNTRIFYLSAEEFMNEFVLKLKTNAMDSFQAKFRNSCDILLIDDIQFIAGKKHIQDEFFHTFNALQQKQKQIVLTSDKYPQEISDLEARLKSRFLQGLIADIQSPDMETRLAILKRKADDENILLPDEVALFLATSMKTNVRELEGALINLAAHSSLENVPIDIDFATRTLNKIVVLREISLSVENIQKAVCKHFNITVDELTGSSRQRSVAYPRQVAMYLCRKGLQSSFPEIGKKFGGKDHTTAMAACRRIEMKIKQDVSARSKIDTLERMLGF
ncbi:MAG: chromosomal replication initiator protein DnaA [Deltaproteobacteria bacterium]|nr:chromosomal replication initiator protein DnaA [Deltaproteobacteria bacterium]